MQLNLSTTAILGTEESDRCREVETRVNVWTVRLKSGRCRELRLLVEVRLKKKNWVVWDTAVSRKVVGKSERDNPERYCGWFSFHCFFKEVSKNGKKGHVCLRVLKKSNKSRFDSYSVRSKCIDHIPYYPSDCRVHSFCDTLSRNSCKNR